MSCLHNVVHIALKCLPFSWGVPISVWLSIVAAVIGYLGVHMAAHPPTEEQKRAKRFYKVSFLILAAMIIALTWRQSYNDGHDKAQIFFTSSNQLVRVQNSFDDFKVTSSNQIVSVQKAFDDYKKVNEHPIPNLPYITIETLPGLPEGMTNDSHLRFHKLIVTNTNDVEINNFCSRLQLPEAISDTIETNQTIGILVSWRPDIIEKMLIKGTGGRNAGGMWIGPESSINPLYPIECFYSPQFRPISAQFSGARVTGIWQLTIDKLPPKSVVSISFLTSDYPDVTNYMKFASVPSSELPPKTETDTNELRYLYEGDYEYQASGKPGKQNFFVPILYDPKERQISSLPVRPDYGHWHPVTLEFY